MARLANDQGSSLIWFSMLLAVTVSVVLVLSCSIHQYLVARNLKDYLEQLTVATLTAWDGNEDVVNVAGKLKQQFQPRLRGFQINQVQLLGGRTLRIEACANWQAPIPVIEIQTELCQEALAR